MLLLVLATSPARQADAQAPAGATPVVCRIGVNVEDVYDIDMARDTFGAILWVWSLCPSLELRPLEAMAFPTASGGLSLGPIETVDIESGGQYASRRVQGTFRYNWDMDHYPFDRQEIAIPIDETRYGARRLVFEPDTAASFLTPDIRDRLHEWRVSDLALAASVSEEASTYGLPDGQGARYARIEASFSLERAQLLTFLKLTSGIYAGVFIAFLTFFYDPNDRGSFGGKLGLLVGVLFAVLINMRAADASIGDTGQLTLVTAIHLLTLVLVVALAIVALWDRRRSELGLRIRHPDWPTVGVVGGLYLLVLAGLVLRAAWS